MRRAPVVTFLSAVLISSWAVASSPVASAAACSWFQVSVPSPGTVQTLGSIDGSGTDVWAVGSYATSTGRYRSLALHGSDEEWVSTTVPFVRRRDNQLQGVSFVAPDDVWAVGALSRPKKAANLIEHWDGQAWTRTAAPSYGRAKEMLYAVDSTSPSDLPIDPLTSTRSWAVGWSTDQEGKRSKAQMLMYDGVAWTTQEIPRPKGQSVLAGVLVFSADDAWAAGYSLSGGVSKPYLIHFDGTAWSRVTVPNPNAGTVGSSFLSITGTSSTDLWAVGATGKGRALAMHYDGTTWTRETLPREEAFLYSAAVDADGEVRVAGLELKSSTVDDTMMRRDGGGLWAEEPTPGTEFSMLLDVTAIEGGAQWAAGLSYHESGDQRPYLLRCA